MYTDNQTYDDSAADMRGIESSLDWGGHLHVVVGASMGTMKQTVCIDEKSPTGTTFSIADVAAGPNAGTYYGTSACAAGASPSALATLGPSWDNATLTFGGGNLEPTDVAEKCMTDGQTFATAVQAYRAEHNVYPAGHDVRAVFQTLLADNLLVAPQQYAGSGRGTWSYDVTTHEVNTTTC